MGKQIKIGDQTLEEFLEEMERELGLDTPSGDGIHKHKCDKCGCIWEHPDKCGEEHCDADHQCPMCGEEEYYKYHGDTPTNYTFVENGKYKCVAEMFKK